MEGKRWVFALSAALLVWLATATPAVQAVARVTGLSSQPQPVGAHWVDTWAATPQLTEPANLPPAPFTTGDSVLTNATVRQTIHVTLGGDQLRIAFSNAFGGSDLTITRAVVAQPAGGLAGARGIVPGTAEPLTFGGNSSVEIPIGAQALSDPVSVSVPRHSNLSVTIYLAQGQASTSVTSHPGSRTTTWMLAGDHTTDADLPGATSAEHWFFISAAQVIAPKRADDVAVLGDSLADGRGSTENGNDRWPDDLANRLLANSSTKEVGVINQGEGGNCILENPDAGTGCLGPDAFSRLDRDVISQPGVKSLIVFEGVNDIGTTPATPAAQQQVLQELESADRQIVTQAHAAGIRVYGATITPFGGNTMYDDPQHLRQQTREEFNDWMRTSDTFDGVFDFDAVVRDPADPSRLLPAFDSGDHLHLTPGGYQALADSIPLKDFAGKS
jgi:lysophospholipase L1-like esterase